MEASGGPTSTEVSQPPPPLPLLASSSSNPSAGASSPGLNGGYGEGSGEDGSSSQAMQRSPAGEGVEGPVGSPLTLAMPAAHAGGGKAVTPPTASSLGMSVLIQVPQGNELSTSNSTTSPSSPQLPPPPPPPPPLSGQDPSSGGGSISSTSSAMAAMQQLSPAGGPIPLPGGVGEAPGSGNMGPQLPPQQQRLPTMQHQNSQGMVGQPSPRLQQQAPSPLALPMPSPTMSGQPQPQQQQPPTPQQTPHPQMPALQPLPLSRGPQQQMPGMGGPPHPQQHPYHQQQQHQGGRGGMMMQQPHHPQQQRQQQPPSGYGGGMQHQQQHRTPQQGPLPNPGMAPPPQQMPQQMQPGGHGGMRVQHMGNAGAPHAPAHMQQGKGGIPPPATFTMVGGQAPPGMVNGMVGPPPQQQQQMMMAPGQAPPPAQGQGGMKGPQQQQMMMMQQQGGGPRGMVMGPGGQPQQQQGLPPTLQQQPGGQGPPQQLPPNQQGIRQEMVKNIVSLLQQRKPHSQNDPNKGQVETRLKEMAVRLEDYLWKRSNNNIEEYSNLSTLKHRLQLLAVYMGKQGRGHQQGAQANPQQQQGGGGGGGMMAAPGMVQGGQQAPPLQQQQQQQGGYHPPPPPQQQQMPPGQGPPPPQQQQGGVPLQRVVPTVNANNIHLPNHNVGPAGNAMIMQPGSAIAEQQGPPMQRRPQGQGPPQQGGAQQVVGYYGQQQQGGRGPPPRGPPMNGGGLVQQQQQQQQGGGPSPTGGPMMGPPGVPPQYAQQQQQPMYGGQDPANRMPPQAQQGGPGQGGGGQPLQQQPGQGGGGGQVPGEGGGGQSMSRLQHTPEQRQQILHQQQQRLLYLRHASKCSHVEGRCPQGYPNCKGMKELWKHIASCREQRCTYPHCVSSRYVLSHYHKCKDETCPVCGPVRNTIRSTRHPQPGMIPPGAQGGPPPPPQQQTPFMNQQGGAAGEGGGGRGGGLPPGVGGPNGAPPSQQGGGGKGGRGGAGGRRGSGRGAGAPDSKPGGAMGGAGVAQVPGGGAMPMPAMANANNLVSSVGPPPQRGGGQGQNLGKGGGRGAKREAPVDADGGRGMEKMARMSPRAGMAGGPGSMKVDGGRGQQALPPQQQQQQWVGGPGGGPRGPPHPGHGHPSHPGQPTPGAPSAAQLQRFEDSVSLVNAFTDEQILAHMESLRTGGYLTPSKIKNKCIPLIAKQLRSEYGWIFEEPVDPVKLGLPDYFDVIKNPMDLGTIRRRLETGTYYTELDRVAADVKLTFDNAILYNPPGQEIHKVAKDMKESFFRDYRLLNEEIRKEQEMTVAKGESCLLCGCEKLFFEPPMYYCNGQCNSSRIRRNSYFYSGGRNQYHWCVPCYQEIRGEEIQIGGHILKKSELIKEKNDKVTEESWVACDSCQQWVHQVCALFNGRNDQGEAVKYYCPGCTLKRRRQTGSGPSCQPLSAKYMKHNRFSEFIEKRVLIKYRECHEQLIRESRKELRPKLIKEFERTSVHVRQVLNTDKTFPVRERMLKRYSAQDYPNEFPAKSKCLVLFQNIDGVDVILFAMYVYEYGHQCPLPNQRRVYISYLDSVHYFRPREFRTSIYHEMIIAYLDYVRRRGFHTAHIWACPPYKGDDYILHCHPQDQKVPREDRLRKWYWTMLETAKEQGIVDNITTLYDENFLDPNNDATVLPYMEGDYWIGEVENLIKEIEEEDKEDPEDADGSSKKRRAQKKKNNKRTIRRLADGTGAEDSRDPVMERLGEIINQMKESFIVARLRPVEYAKACADRLMQEIAQAKAKKQALIDSGQSEHPIPSAALPSSAKTLPPSASSGGGGPSDGGKVKTEGGLTEVKTEGGVAVKAEGGEAGGDGSQGSQGGGGEGKDGINASGGGYPELPLIPNPQMGPDGKLVDETLDPDPNEECEIFDTRSEFLDFCKGNHYQYDFLRRAKHSSMMVLYHLLNPDAPKFLPSCVLCCKDITGPTKWTCQAGCDEDFSICQDCYSNGGWRNHRHTLVRVPIRSRQQGEGADNSDMLRHKEMLRRHLELLVHSCTCKKSDCIPNCLKMRELLKHVHECPIKSQGGCKKCRRVWLLLQYHAKNCKNKECHVPKCAQIREALRMRHLQQLAMEDRRRAAQNSTIGYRAKPKEEEEEEEAGGGGGGRAGTAAAASSAGGGA